MSTMHGQKVLITGGSGFIGSYLAMALLKKGEHVVLFDRDPDLRRITGFGAQFEPFKKQLTFVQGDISLLAHTLAVFDKHEPKGVFHLGALLSAGAESNPTMGFQVDLVGTWNVLEATRLYCQHRNAAPIKVMFPSTIASFGSFIAPGQKVKNEDVQMPTTMYGTSKVAVERLGEYYSAQARQWVDFRAVRFPSVLGAARGPGGTTVYSTLMIQEPLLGKAYEAYVAEDTRLDILYVKDAIEALMQLHDADPATLRRRVYNIAGIRSGDQAPSAAEIKAAVEKIAGPGAITFKVNQTLSDIVHTFGILDDSAAREDWGWKGASFNLDQTVADFKAELDAFPDRIKAIELFGA
ncbi:NAD-dependent epimerase/dehydratase family protein [Paraburkholderia mimosarum]|uniref:NAD-dependent epimerase/dehydratase family protein n=1 Tax=Paraburkholderia mimosarum TaxID=312026 RepID=UPI00047F621C|nr:NAD-dependent epimerase/dehydratase family protein [Paraburkholderia mimosarum]